jgi:hypothetical protein
MTIKCLFYLVPASNFEKNDILININQADGTAGQEAGRADFSTCK